MTVNFQTKFWIFTLNNPVLENDDPRMWNGMVWCVFQKEQGVEGTEHYQGYVILPRTHELKWCKKHLNNRAHWEPRHGSHDQAKAYCSKEATRIDGPYYVGEEPKKLNIPALIPKLDKKGVWSEVAERIESGATFDDIYGWNSGFALREKRKLDDALLYHEVKRARKDINDGVVTLIVNNVTYSIPIGVSLPHKTRQYFINGPIDSGKSTIYIKLLEFGLRGYPIPNDGKFDGYDDSFDFAYIDEVKTLRNVQVMNNFLEGTTMILQARYRNILKKKNLPCFVMSNFTLEECFKMKGQMTLAQMDPTLKEREMETVKRRYTEITLPGRPWYPTLTWQPTNIVPIVIDQSLTAPNTPVTQVVNEDDILPDSPHSINEFLDRQRMLSMMTDSVSAFK